MKLKDLIHAINEMAMTNYGRYGDFDNSKAFPNKKDQELIQSEKHPIRTENAFKNVKQNVACYFIADKWLESDMISLESLASSLDSRLDIYQPMIDELHESKENTISFIFTGNRNVDGYVGSTKATPLTGWTPILATLSTSLHLDL